MKSPSTDSFYVYLSSSDLGADQADKNTTVQFSNTLPENLYFDKSQNWSVALQYIQLSNFFGSAAIELIKVHCDLVQPTTTQDNSLSFFTRPEYNQDSGRLCFHEPGVKEFFSLATSVISSVSIRLTDQNDKLLKLKIGQPSIVCLHFKKMKSNKQSFVIRVKSSDDSDGTADDFRATLPPALSADPNKKWAVGLNSFVFKGRFKQHEYLEEPRIYVRSWDERVKAVPKPKKPQLASNQIASNQLDTSNAETMEEGEEEEEEEESSSDDEVEVEQFNIQSDSIMFSTEHFLDNEKMFLAFKSAISKHKFPSARGKSENFTRVRMNPISGRVSFNVQRHTEFSITQQLASMLGLFRTPNSENHVVVVLRPYEEIQFERPMNCNIWVPNSVFIYANFINFSPIGRVESPVLKIVPIKALPEPNEFGRFEAKNIEMHSVIFSQLSNLRFQIRRIDGAPITFDPNFPSEIILSLQFVEI